ncbi:MAG: alpha/beta hydrolase [Pseudomonadota bacterium]
MSDTPPIPDWFFRAVEAPYSDHFVDVQGCPIHYQKWSDVDRRGLLFVHGYSANSHWWDFIAPFFAEDYRVVAMDMAGMGDSGWRESYTGETFAEEIIRVAEDAELEDDMYVIAHSFGGSASILAGALYPEKLDGLILVDSPVRPPSEELDGPSRLGSGGRTSRFADLNTAIARFRLQPSQPCENGYLVDYIAQHSARQGQDEDWWYWKYDEHGLAGVDFGGRDRNRDFADLACRVGLLYGEKSELVTPEIVDHMSYLMDDMESMVGIPESYHHLMLDQPLAFVSALRTMISGWRHSNPLRQKGY